MDTFTGDFLCVIYITFHYIFKLLHMRTATLTTTGTPRWFSAGVIAGYTRISFLTNTTALRNDNG